MSKLRLALIGAGEMGRRHMATIAASAEAELVAVADPVAEVRELAGALGATWFADFEAMLEAAKPDGVVIATPTEIHLPPALAALGAGAHILLEKPIAPTLAAAERIRARAETAGRHVLVGHHRRYYRLVEKTRGLLNEGAIGDLVGVNVQWTLLKPDTYFVPDWRKKREAGPVLTNLIHDMDLLRYLCGEVACVQAMLDNRVRGLEKEDTGAITLRFTSGVLATVLLSDGAASPWAWEMATGENPSFPPQHRNAYRFVGTEGALEFPNLVLWSYRNGERGWTYPLLPQSLRIDLGNAFEQQMAHFCEVIRGLETPRIDARDAMATLAATLAVFEANESGGTVRP